MGNWECGIGNGELGMRNAECGMWNVECGMWNAECRRGFNPEHWNVRGVSTPNFLILVMENKGDG
jgi:hypothetical protein